MASGYGSVRFSAPDEPHQLYAARVVTQYALAIILIVTSDGRLEVAIPVTDDDRRDMEIHEVHKHAAPRLDGDRWTFNFGASLDPASKDRWVPFRVRTQDVGKRVLDIFGNAQIRRDASPLPAELTGLDGLVLVGPQDWGDTN